VVLAELLLLEQAKTKIKFRLFTKKSNYGIIEEFIPYVRLTVPLARDVHEAPRVFKFVRSRFRSVIAKIYIGKDFIFLMGWKNWPYWKKSTFLGALIGFVFPFTLGVPLIISNLSIPPFFFTDMEFQNLTNCYGEICLFLGLLYYSIFYAFLGALVGWIYGKIKSRKSSSE
jgi:hypothetical protein